MHYKVDTMDICEMIITFYREYIIIVTAMTMFMELSS